MIRLFYIPGACSFGPHMALREAGLPFQLERVSFVDAASGDPIPVLNAAARQRGYRAVYGDGQPFAAISPKALVPTLVTPDGHVLTEGVAIYEYIADAAPDAGLAPGVADPERYLFLSWLGEIASRVHKAIHLLAHYGIGDPIREEWRAEMVRFLDRAAETIRAQGHLLSRFSLADLYLFMNWHVAVDVILGSFERWADLSGYFRSIAARPAVQEAIALEGTAARYLRDIGEIRT